MKFQIFKIWWLLALGICSSTSCKKFLDAKSDGKLAIPSTLVDLQAMLDNDFLINTGTTSINQSTDEYYLLDATWTSMNERAKQEYIWDYQPETENNTDWLLLYNAVLYTNTVLERLEDIDQNRNPDKWNSIKGSALFLRAWYFFLLSQTYAPQYDASTAGGDFGIPVRLSSDFNKPTTRPSVQEMFDQIIKDAELATSFLPVDAGFKTRPSKPAAYALLARVYLQMGDYSKAKENADKCLNIFSTLIDYNNIPVAVAPFTRLNEETIFYSKISPTNAYDFWAKTDSVNYASYDDNDLRKELFFEPSSNSSYVYTGSYNGRYTLFTGFATDELLLIRAECFARMNDPIGAKNDLNTLLEKRWVTGTYSDFNPSDANEALIRVLQERKRELINRGTRWSDLRRLNKESQFAVTLIRVINGQTYTLPPNDPRYTMLIPKNVIQLTGIKQNDR